MKGTLLLIVILVSASLWAIDSLISAEEMIEDENGNYIGSKPSEYSGLWDYILKKFKK